MAVGVVSDAEIEDATPASVVAHTRKRSDRLILSVCSITLNLK